MQSNNRKVFETIVSRSKIYLVIILILLIIISVENRAMIMPSIIIYAVIVLYTYFTNKKRKSEISETLQDLTLTVDSAAKTSLINSPFPLIILQTNGNIIWKSSKFNSEFANIDINTYIDDLVLDIKDEIKKRKDHNNKDILRKIEIGSKVYEVKGRYVNAKNKEKNKKDYMIILYFIDDTENIKLKNAYQGSRTCIASLVIDNYEETIQQIESEQRPQVIAEIEKGIYDWTNITNGVLIKQEKDRYICFFEQKYLDTIKEDKFSILDKIKEIDTKEIVQFTLSIAVSNEGDTDSEKYKSVQAAMDIVLGRGGDQAVIRENEIYKLFGGRAQEVEKRTKVKARVVAHALENLIKESKKVMIMGHTNPDMDCIGASMGIYRLAKCLETNAYIVSDEHAPTLEQFITSIEKEEEYDDIIINKEVALENIDEETLLVVVDTHKANYVESPELLKKAKNRLAIKKAICIPNLK